jgi:hypothetical protein
MVMEVNPHAASLLDAIKDGTAPWKEGKQAPVALLRSTPPKMHCMVVRKGSVKVTW